MSRRAAALLAAGVLTLGLGGCSDSTSDGVGDPASEAADAGWSPCDGLTPASVRRIVGEAVDENEGSLAEPRCTFTPRKKGGAAYDVSYLWFDGGLDEALNAMGEAGSQLKAVDVAGADSARLAVRARKGGVVVTGFVQTGGLVQSVNAAQLKPYDQQQVVAGTLGLMAELVAQAPDEAHG